ncbi:MAG: cytochrome c biogenesis protein CcdA, partial [Planctomycetota bacterium]
AYAPTYADHVIENYPQIAPATGGDVSVLPKVSTHYLPIEIATDASGSVTIAGTAQVQVCDDMSCLAPASPAWSITLPVVASGEAVATGGPEFDGFDPATWAALKPLPEAGADNESSSSDQVVELFGYEMDLSNLGPAVVLLLAFVAGIFFNVVPCVLPVLPLKIISFYETAQHSRAKCLAHGVAFSVGIVVLFAILAVLMFAFKAISWGQLFSNVWFSGGVTLLLVAAAAYQFGLLQFALPTNVYAAEQSATGGRGAIAGNIAAGAFTAILSTPCTFGLFLGILIWAGAQPTWLGVLTIIVVGVGMASPYTLLSAFPGIARSLPQSGRWSEVVKQATGFILLGVAVYFARPLLPEVVRGPWLWWVIWASLLACGLYLVGAAVRYKQGYVVTGIVTLVLAGGTLPIAYGFANPPVGWAKFGDESLAEARASEGPVLVKFTADWCANCQTIERNVFGTQDQIDALADQGVTLMKADLTDADAAGWPLLSELNPARAIPYTVVYLPGQDEPVRLVGIYGEDDVQEALAK